MARYCDKCGSCHYLEQPCIVRKPLTQKQIESWVKKMLKEPKPTKPSSIDKFRF
jgi:hypothetical protein